MEIELTQLTEKFIAKVAELKSRRIIKTDNELASTINYPSTNLSAVLKGKRNIPYKYVFDFATAYQIPHFFSDEGATSDKGSPEPLYVRPYNLPIIQTTRQKEYLKRHEELRFIESLPRRPILQKVDNRGAEWRWFQAGGSLKIKEYHEDDMWLCRMIHSEDWQLMEADKNYIILTDNKLLFKKLIEISEKVFFFCDLVSKKISRVPLKSIREFWIVRYSLLSESGFYQKKLDSFIHLGNISKSDKNKPNKI